MANFTLDQIKELVNQGYKFEDIMKVNGDPAPVEDPKPIENPVGPVEKPAPVPVEKTAPADTGNKAILDAINNLTQVIQAGNIRMGGFPAPVGQVNPEDVLANIINPPGYTAGKK